MWNLTEQRTFQIQQGIRFGFQFITAWLLIRIVPDQVFLAEYESIVILSSGFSAALVFGLTQKLIQSQKEEAELISTLTRMGFAVSCAFAAFVFLIGYFSPKIHHLYALSFASAHIAFHLPSFLLDQWLVQKKRLQIALCITFFSNFIPFLCTIGLVYYQFSVTTIFLAIFSISFIKWVIMMFLTRLIPISPIKNHWKPLFTLMGIFFTAASAEMFDHWFIQQFCSNQELIIFRYGARELPISLIFANAFSNYISNRIAQNPSEDFSQWIKIGTTTVCHQIFLPVIFLLFISNTLFAYLYPLNIQESVFIFDCFLLLAIPRTLFPQSILLAYGLNNALFKVTIVETFIHILITLALFPLFGFYSAIFAVGIAYSFEKIMLLRICYWFKMNPIAWIPWKIWLFYSTVLILLFYGKWFF